MARVRRSSLNSSELCVKWNPDSSSWRTCQPSSPEESTLFLGRWPTSGSMRNGVCYQRPTAELITSENESGSCAGSKMWLTPRAADTGKGENPETFSDRRPMLRETWPTPNARDRKVGYAGGRMRNGKYSWDSLDVAVQYTDNQSKTLGHLNPDWVEWLMNFPIGWTSIEPLAVNGGLPSLQSTDCPSEPKIEQDDCEGSEMHKRQLLRQQHLSTFGSDTGPKILIPSSSNP